MVLMPIVMITMIIIILTIQLALTHLAKHIHRLELLPIRQDHRFHLDFAVVRKSGLTPV